MMHTFARNTFGRIPGLLVFLALCFTTASADAQPTNVEIFQHLAVECIVDVEVPDSIVVDAGDARDYVRSAITSYLIDRDRRVYAVDADVDSMAVLHLRHDPPELTYSRSGRRIARNASLSLHLLMIMPGGRVAADRACRRSFDDVVERRMLAQLESSAWPETKPPAPPASWRRRYLEPVIMAGATAVTVLLFFSLRSKRAADE